MKQVKNCKKDSCNCQIVIGGDSGEAGDGAGISDEGGEESGTRERETAAVTDHEKRQGRQECEVDHGGGGMAAEREGYQEQHLGTLRKVGVHAVVIPDEAVMPPVARHVAEVIAGTIGADLGGHGIKEIHDEKSSK